MELHHPIISKLWDLGGKTKRKKIKEYTYCNAFICNIEFSDCLSLINTKFIIEQDGSAKSKRILKRRLFRKVEEDA